MSTFIHLMRGQMSKPLDELGGNCPNIPFLDRGQMSEGEHVRPPVILVVLARHLSDRIKIFRQDSMKFCWTSTFRQALHGHPIWPTRL